MISYLKCEKCNEVFSEEQAGERIEIEYDDARGQRSGTFVHVRLCPIAKCSSDQLQEDYAKCENDCSNEALLGCEICAGCLATDPADFRDYARRWPEDIKASLEQLDQDHWAHQMDQDVEYATAQGADGSQT